MIPEGGRGAPIPPVLFTDRWKTKPMRSKIAVLLAVGLLAGATFTPTASATDGSSSVRFWMVESSPSYWALGMRAFISWRPKRLSPKTSSRSMRWRFSTVGVESYFAAASVSKRGMTLLIERRSREIGMVQAGNSRPRGSGSRPAGAILG